MRDVALNVDRPNIWKGMALFCININAVLKPTPTSEGFFPRTWKTNFCFTQNPLIRSSYPSVRPLPHQLLKHPLFPSVGPHWEIESEFPSKLDFINPHYVICSKSCSRTNWPPVGLSYVLSKMNQLKMSEGTLILDSHGFGEFVLRRVWNEQPPPQAGSTTYWQVFFSSADHCRLHKVFVFFPLPACTMHWGLGLLHPSGCGALP